MADALATKIQQRVMSEFGSAAPPDPRFYKAIAEETLDYIAANAIFTFSIGGVTPGTGVTVVGTIQVAFPPQVY